VKKGPREISPNSPYFTFDIALHSSEPLDQAPTVDTYLRALPERILRCSILRGSSWSRESQLLLGRRGRSCTSRIMDRTDGAMEPVGGRFS
jgi:hypothetical protein